MRVWLALAGLIPACADPPVEVEVGQVERRELVEVVTAKGRIAPKRYVRVVAERDGRLIEIHVKKGDRVEKGQLLARLQVAKTPQLRAIGASGELWQTEYRAALTAIEAAKAGEAAQSAALEESEIELARSEKDYERAVLLNREGLISRNDFETAKQQHEAAQAAVRQSKESLRQMAGEETRLERKHQEALEQIERRDSQRKRLEQALRRYPVIAPIDGVVSAVLREVDAEVVREDGEADATPLVTIGDISELHVSIEDRRLDLGQAVKVEAGNATFSGTIAEVANGASVVALDGKVELEIDSKCLVVVEKRGASQSLAVPLGALAKQESGNKLDGVFVVEEGRANFQPVKTGLSNNGWIEITEGLSAGQMIALDSARDGLVPGARVAAVPRN